MNFAEWASHTWYIFATAVAAIAVIIQGIRYIKALKEGIERPFHEINNKLDDIAAKQEMQNRAVLTLQRRSLLDACENYLQKGCATLNEKEALSKQFESYRELGGNSFVCELVEQVKELPIN